MTDFDFKVPQQQHVLAVVVYFFKNLRNLINGLLPLIAFAAIKPGSFYILAGAIILGVILNCVFAWLQHKNFSFYVDNRELIINKGVFVKDRIAIPLERVQTVQLHQNIIQKALNLFAVKVDTAGSKAEELEIPALETHKARAFQEMLRKEKAKIISDVPDVDQGIISEENGEEDHVIDLVKLDILKLLKVGVTENHIRRGLLVLAIIFGYASQYQSIFDNYVEPWFEENYAKIASFSITVVLVGIIVFLILSTVLSLIITILKHYNFKAILKHGLIDIEEGLLKRNEYRIPLNKVQFLEWRSNPLRKIWDIETVRIFQSQSAEQKRKQSIEIPACEKRETRIILKEVFEEDPEAVYNSIETHKFTYTLFHFYILGIPLLLFTSVVWYFDYYSSIPILLLLFISMILVAYKNGQKMKVESNGELLSIRKGWIFPVRIVIPIYKIQALQKNQSIFLLRKNLAHLNVITASGDRTIRFLNSREVDKLYDYILAKVEMHKGPWM